MPTRTVTATVTERTIALDRKHVTQNNVSIDRLVLALDAEWEGCDDVKVMFYQDGASVLVDYAEGGIDFPAEIVANLETLRLTVLGYFANGDRIVTKKMSAADAITVDESGMLEAQGTVEATKDAYQRLFEAAGNIDASEASAKTSMEAAREAAASAQASANALAGAAWSGNVPKATVSGSLVHVEDAYPSPVVEARVEGRSSQEGTPSPESPKPVESIEAVELVVTGADTSVATRYAVDLKGEELRSLPDGTRDELVVDAAGGYGILKRVGSGTVDGSERIGYKTFTASGGTIQYETGDIGIGETMFQAVPLSTHFAASNGNNWNKYDNTVYYGGTDGQLVQISVSPEIATSEDEWKQWVKANPFGVFRTLKAPTYVPLGTLDEAVRLPEKTSNVWIEAGKDTIISVTYARDVNDILAALEALLNN